MKKRILSILLVLAMSVSLLTACGGKGTDNTGSNTDTGSDSTDNTATGSDEKYTVVMGYIGNTHADEALVEAEINKILEPALNANIDLRPFSWGGYQQELQLTLSGDEKLDIVPIIVTNAAGYVSNGQVLDLTNLIEQHGTNIKKVMDPDFITTPKIGDFTYGVTSMREQITWEGAIMRADILQELGYTVENNICTDITNMDQLGEAYAKIKAKYPDMNMLGSTTGGTPLMRWEIHDALTDGFGVLMNYGQDTKVVNLYETEEFKQFAKTIYDWNQKGFLSKDAATTTETLQNQVKSGNTFSYFTPLKAGAVEQDELNTGYDLAISPLFGDAYVTSYSVNFFTWGIARNSTNPEKAFQVLDYIYGSADVMNLLNWGIEGKHYKVIDAENKVIGFADGVTADTTGYFNNIGWELPNQEIAYVWEGETAAKWDTQREYIANANRSKALGFSYDTTNVSNQLTALNNVKNQWYDAIGSGSVNPEEAIPQFNQALYDAGLQDVMDAKQQQLDAWLATQQ
jgi:putative aldouronate transport system substrate-binding protein